MTRFAKSQLVTSAATVIEWVCVWLLVAIGTYYVIAAVLGAVVGAVVDFSFKKWWVFGTGRHLAAGEAMRYAVVSGLSALVFGGVVYAFVDGLGWRTPIAVIAGSLIVGIFWNYPLHRYFVFPVSRSAEAVS